MQIKVLMWSTISFFHGWRWQVLMCTSSYPTHNTANLCTVVLCKLRNSCENYIISKAQPFIQTPQRGGLQEKWWLYIQGVLRVLNGLSMLKLSQNSSMLQGSFCDVIGQTLHLLTSLPW